MIGIDAYVGTTIADDHARTGRRPVREAQPVQAVYVGPGPAVGTAPSDAARVGDTDYMSMLSTALRATGGAMGGTDEEKAAAAKKKAEADKQAAEDAVTLRRNLIIAAVIAGALGWYFLLRKPTQSVALVRAA